MFILIYIYLGIQVLWFSIKHIGHLSSFTNCFLNIIFLFLFFLFCWDKHLCSIDFLKVFLS